MSRDLPAELITALSTPGNVSGVIALMAEFDFDSGTIGMWTGLGNITFNGVTFFGGGNLIGISAYQETLDLQAQGMTFTLSGVASDLIEITENEPYQGRAVRLSIALVDIESFIAKEDGTGVILTEGGGRIRLESTVNATYRLFSGLMDVMDTQDDSTTSTIQLSAENVLTLLKRSKTRRYTDEDQKARYPDDDGLSFIAALQDKDLIW
jgi:hypothetical protein